MAKWYECADFLVIVWLDVMGFFDSGGLKISWNWFDATVKLKIVDFLMRGVARL